MTATEQQSPKQRRRRFYTHSALWAILILAAGIFLAWPRLKARYQRWNASNQIQLAERMLIEKDFNRAVMTARSVLAVDPTNVNAMRIVAKALEAAGSPGAAQWRGRIEAIEPGDPENILAWAAATVKVGDLSATERVLSLLPPDSRESATYHSIAAELSTAKRDSVAAESHLAEALRLDPSQDRYRLALAALRVRSTDRDLQAGAMATLTELSEKSPKNLQAVRLLLAEALRSEEWKKADALSKALVADSASTFVDKLQRLAALRKMDKQEAPGYLMELRNDALSNPAELYTLLMWMNENSLSMMVIEWVRTLPMESITVPPACVAVADAYARASEWRKLRDFLDDHEWADSDYLRRAFLCRALERLDEAELAAQEWKDGLAAARSRNDAGNRLERLAKVAVNWGWERRAEEVMWILAGSPGCPRWVLDSLWAAAGNRADTAQLQKLAGMLSKADPQSVAFRNAYAFLSLLVRSEDGNPQRESEKLFKENPGNPTVAVTWALSLYQQGKVAEAVAVTGSLPPKDLEKPQIAIYHAIFLSAAGEGPKAAEFLTVAKSWKMLPEEKALLDRAKLLAGKAGDERAVAEAARTAMAARAAREVERDLAAEAARATRAAQAAQAVGIAK